MAQGTVNSFNANVPLPALGVGEYPAELWYADNMGRYFDRFKGYNDPNLSGHFLVLDYEGMRNFVANTAGFDDTWRMPTQFNINRNASEKNRSFYLQWRNSFDWVVPVSMSAGVRHENTKVNSPASITPPAGNLVWSNLNIFAYALADAPVLSNYTGEYSYWLPHVDARVELRDNLVLRGSYGKSIGRPSWLDIQGGLSLDARYQLFGGTGNEGNPGLLPLESKNVDLSLEWYYGEGSYASMGYFRKSITNFVGNVITTQSPYQIYSPIRGRYWRRLH